MLVKELRPQGERNKPENRLQRKRFMTAPQWMEPLISQGRLDESNGAAPTMAMSTGCFKRATVDVLVPADDTFESCVDVSGFLASVVCTFS